jgi:dTMP kinase
MSVLKSQIEMQFGPFITFEGIDGSGKSTQLRLLVRELNRRGLSIVTTREPGGTSLGSRIRTLLLDTNDHVDPLAELLLYAADRAQHVRTMIRPALAAGRMVISDRYADATIAYQGAGRGFPQDIIQHVISLATEGLKPDLTLLFDISIEEGRSRMRKRDKEHRGNRLDREEAAFHDRVRQSYLHLAANEPNRIKVINASGSIDETHKLVIKAIDSFFKTR